MTVEKPDFLSLVARIQAKHEESLSDPQRTAQRERELQRARRREENAALVALTRVMNERGIPNHHDLRALCALPTLWAQAANVPAMRAIAEAEGWMHARGDQSPFVLVLSGAPGCGKSCALARWIARSDESAVFVRSTTIASTPRNDWSENREQWDRWSKTKRLAIDEFGLEESRSIGTRLNALLCERHDNGNATIIATNLDEQAVVDALFDARLASRVLGEQGRGGLGGGLPFFVSLPVADLRLPEAIDG